MKWTARKVNGLKDAFAYVIDEVESGQCICTIELEGSKNEEIEDIARLIAAAPKIFNLLRQISSLDLYDKTAGAEYATLSHKAKELIKNITQ